MCLSACLLGWRLDGFADVFTFSETCSLDSQYTSHLCTTPHIAPTKTVLTYAQTAFIGMLHVLPACPKAVLACSGRIQTAMNIRESRKQMHLKR